MNHKLTLKVIMSLCARANRTSNEHHEDFDIGLGQIHATTVKCIIYIEIL